MTPQKFTTLCIIVIIFMASCSCCNSMPINIRLPFFLNSRSSNHRNQSIPVPSNMYCEPTKISDPNSPNSKIPNTFEVEQLKTEPLSFKRVFIRNSLGVWGVANVLAILANAIKRLFPVAIQPFIAKDMVPVQWAAYVLWCVYMAYAEGYKAFHQKFAPTAVHRAFHIHENKSILNILLAGPYSMGLFGASRKRMIVSWSITAGVFALITIVKQLPYPYRSIVDAGVVVGLSLGSLSIIWHSVWAMFGKMPVIEDEKPKTQ